MPAGVATGDGELLVGSGFCVAEEQATKATQANRIITPRIKASFFAVMDIARRPVPTQGAG